MSRRRRSGDGAGRRAEPLGPFGPTSRSGGRLTTARRRPTGGHLHRRRRRDATLAELKRLGVRLAIDDFGTGYSSLSYLDRLPVDVLKIDRSFTQQITAACKESALARAIIGLGPTLGLKTIAEGIETTEQWDALRDLGCDLGQGYLMSRPLDVKGVEAMWAGAPHSLGLSTDGASCAA